MKIIYTRPDGGVSVVVPSPNWSGSIQELAEKDVPREFSYEIVEDDVIPTDRTFRNAWKKQDKGVVVDEGTFLELRNSSPIFQELWKHQEDIREEVNLL